MLNLAWIESHLKAPPNAEYPSEPETARQVKEEKLKMRAEERYMEER